MFTVKRQSKTQSDFLPTDHKKISDLQILTNNYLKKIHNAPTRRNINELHKSPKHQNITNSFRTEKVYFYKKKEPAENLTRPLFSTSHYNRKF
jgi:hypothetical protein